MITKRKPQPIVGNFRLLPVHPDTYCIVDIADYEQQKRYRWQLARSNHCQYVLRRIRHNGHSTEIRLHRAIMHTPPDMDCHHKNRKTLDCRRSNLANLKTETHRLLHKTNPHC